jgi:cell division protein ZipA
MEGYLRVALVVMGSLIIVFIVMEGWLSKRRQLKLADLSANYSSDLTLNPDGALSSRAHDHQFNAELNHTEDAHDQVLRNTTAVAEKSGFKAIPLEQPFEHAQTRSAYSIQKPVVNYPAAEKPKVVPEKPAAQEFTNDLLVLCVVALPGETFASYELMQAISGTGLQFGEMNIFHYYFSTPEGKKPIFSLASATEPGEFNMDRVGEISCTGLTLFTLLNNVPNPQHAFDLMLKSAEQLADDLGGELRAGPRKPLTDEVFEQYQQKVLHYQLKKRA